MSVPTRPLTPARMQVLRGIADGKTAEQIAVEQYCAPGTIRKRVREVYLCLNARNAPHAVHIAHNLGLLGSESAS